MRPRREERCYRFAIPPGARWTKRAGGKGERVSSWLRITFRPVCTARARGIPFVDRWMRRTKGTPRALQGWMTRGNWGTSRTRGKERSRRTGAVHARAGHGGKKCEAAFPPFVRPRKWSAENVDRVNAARNKHGRYDESSRDTRGRIHMSTNHVVLGRLNYAACNRYDVCEPWNSAKLSVVFSVTMSEMILYFTCIYVIKVFLKKKIQTKLLIRISFFMIKKKRICNKK